MNNRSRFKDLVEELSGWYSDFEITDGLIYFIEGDKRELEGQIKVIATDCCNYKLRVYISKMRKTVFSKVIDPDDLTDPEEQAKILEILTEVDLLLNGESSLVR